MDFARHYSEEEIKKMLKSSDFEVISLDANTYEICELSDGHYVSANTGSVTILDENFKIIKKHTIVGSVVGLVLRNVKVSDSTIGFCGDCGVYFYDLNTKTLKNQHLGIVGRMNCIGSNFYVALSSPTKRILCFDQNGNLLEEIVDIKFEILLTNWSDGFMLNCGLKKDFLVSFRTNQKIIRFKI